MTKKLTDAKFNSLLLECDNLKGYVSRLEEGLRAKMKAEAQELYGFEPPQSYDAWLAATNIAGFIGTKSRGDRLKAVDRAYQAWIGYGGPEGIFHAGNAENLRNTLETYIGRIYRLTGPVSGVFARDHRDARNKGDVITNTLRLSSLLATLCARANAASEDRRRAARVSMLTMMANVKLSWSPVGTLLAGLGGAVMAGNEFIDDKNTKLFVQILEGEVAVLATEIAVIADNSIPGQIKKLLNDQWDKFKKWMQDTFNRHFGISNAAELLGCAGKAFAFIIGLIMKEVGKFASGATEIYEGLRGMISDAWTRRTITLQGMELTTSDGAFAMIRKGIDVGIRNRQVVHAWKITKGTTAVTMTAVTGGIATKIADLVLGAFECIFKVIYNKYEESCISDFLLQAKLMWNKSKGPRPPSSPPPAVASLPATPPATAVFTTETSSAAPVAPPAAASTAPAPKANFSVGSMPPFRATNYSPEQFYSDQHGAYLNFLDSLVNASPVLAAVVFNAEMFTTIEDVMHSATPRSTDDVGRAAEHIRTLRIEAERLYRESGFVLALDPSSPAESVITSVSTQVKKATFVKEVEAIPA